MFFEKIKIAFCGGER